jgi:hypothetical protein
MAIAQQEDSLSCFAAAQHLDAQHDRPFAAAQGDTEGHLRLMPGGFIIVHPYDW